MNTPPSPTAQPSPRPSSASAVRSSRTYTFTAAPIAHTSPWMPPTSPCSATAQPMAGPSAKRLGRHRAPSLAPTDGGVMLDLPHLAKTQRLASLSRYLYRQL